MGEDRERCKLLDHFDLTQNAGRAAMLVPVETAAAIYVRRADGKNEMLKTRERAKFYETMQKMSQLPKQFANFFLRNTAAKRDFAFWC